MDANHMHRMSDSILESYSWKSCSDNPRGKAIKPHLKAKDIGKLATNTILWKKKKKEKVGTKTKIRRLLSRNLIEKSISTILLYVEQQQHITRVHQCC